MLAGSKRGNVSRNAAACNLEKVSQDAIAVLAKYSFGVKLQAKHRKCRVS